MARTIKLIIAYDGTDFAGWQSQTAQRTIQDTLELTLAKLTGQFTRVTASGRTDAGVHALGQVVSFDTESTHTPEVFQKALNAELPHDISILSTADAPLGFNARSNAKRKRYRYVIHDGFVPDVFRLRYSWHLYQLLDVDVMCRGAQALLGKHDFSSFQSSGSKRETTERTIFDLTIHRLTAPDDRLIHVEVEADGFLYNMVRNIVGTLAELGAGKQPDGWVSEVLAAKTRRRAGQTAPASGLFLLWVKY